MNSLHLLVLLHYLRLLCSAVMCHAALNFPLTAETLSMSYQSLAAQCIHLIPIPSCMPHFQEQGPAADICRLRFFPKLSFLDDLQLSATVLYNVFPMVSYKSISNGILQSISNGIIY